MKAFHVRLALPVVLLALAAASSLRAGPGVDYWMRKHVFEPQAKAAAAASVATTDQAASTENTKKVEVTKIEHAYRGVPHQVVMQVPAEATTNASTMASSEKPVENNTSGRASSSSSAVIH